MQGVQLGEGIALWTGTVSIMLLLSKPGQRPSLSCYFSISMQQTPDSMQRTLDGTTDPSGAMQALQ